MPKNCSSSSVYSDEARLVMTSCVRVRVRVRVRVWVRARSPCPAILNTLILVP